MENKGFILILIGVILLIGNMFFVFASNDFIDDGDIMPFSHDYVDYKTSSQKGANTEVYLGFERFDVYINSEYYNANTPEIDDFFTEFEERYLILEDLTGWSAEEFYDKKLEIHVTESVGCYGGGGGSGYVSLRFSDPLYMQGCQRASYENGQAYFNNPGELGDNWKYMSVVIHEATHAINPHAIFDRAWLTEGFATYNEYNILEMQGDINRETADHYIYQGSNYFNWEDYVANDYHDTTPDEKEIQESDGYSITAWMFSMLREDYNLDWNVFYDLMQGNSETLSFSESLGDYYTDTNVIDLFERAIGTEMYPIFRYDGSSGPGWGVRHWTSLDWYADLVPELNFSNENPVGGEEIGLIATIYNNGNVDLQGVSVRFYNEDEFLGEQFVDVVSQDNVKANISFAADEGTYQIYVKIDEENVKIESDEDNNVVSKEITFNSSCICGDVNNLEGIDIDDVVYLVNYIFTGGPAPVIYESGDVDLSGDIDIDDVVYLVNYIFTGGPAPCGI